MIIAKPKPANKPQQITTIATQQQKQEGDDQHFKEIKSALDDFVNKYKKYTADEISFDDLPLSEDKIKSMVDELKQNNKISEDESKSLKKLAEIAYGIKNDYPEYKKFPLAVQILYPEIAKNIDMKRLLQYRDNMPTDSHFDILIIQAFNAKAGLENIAKAKKQATNHAITYLLLSLILPILIVAVAYYVFKNHQLGKIETKLSSESNSLTHKAQNYAVDKLNSSKNTTMHSL